MNRVEGITPYGSEGDNRPKGDQVREMFDNIAPAYDVMNRLMTFGIDRNWRKSCVREAAETSPKKVLDIATGTGDLAVALARSIAGSHVTGVDLSPGMIEVGIKKVSEKGLQERIDLQVADALALPFADNTFDVITIAFGIRNFEHLDRGYREMLRVLRPGGKLVVLELTQPRHALVKPFYKFHTRAIIPFVGRIASGDSRAYTYLPESIAAVPARDEMTALMTDAGFSSARWKDLFPGVATLYTSIKP